MKKIVLLLIVCLFTACTANVVPSSEVIYDLQVSSSNLLADGTTMIAVYCYINKDADSDKRSVIFSSNMGTFVPSNDTTSTVTASFENGLLVARTSFKMPLTAGTLHLKARPATVNKFGNYRVEDTVKISASVPTTLKLLPSSLGLKAGFDNEITLTATLKNSFGNNVSSGTRVLFENLPAGGAYRIIKDATDITSTAFRTFSAGAITGPTTVLFRCTYINEIGARTGVKDSCLITITN